MTPLHPKISRATQSNQSIETIERGNSLLIIGCDGIGKTKFLNELNNSANTCEITLLITHTTIKQATLQITESIFNRHGLELPPNLLPENVEKKHRMYGFIEWNDVKYSISRLSIEKIVSIITSSLVSANCKITLYIDDLPTAPTQLSIYKQLFNYCQIIATINSNKMKGDFLKFAHKFPSKIELRPLSNENSQILAKEWLDNHEIRFDSDKVKPLLIKQIANISHGNPAAIVQLLESISKHDSISTKHVKELQTEIGIIYIDMSPILFIPFIVGISARQISRGIGEIEIMILSTVVSAFAIILIYLWRASRRINRY